ASSKARGLAPLLTELIVPKLAAPQVAFGGAKLVWFRVLKASTSTTSAMPSLGRPKERLTEVSRFHEAGLMRPQAPVRGALPIRLRAVDALEGEMVAGALKALVLK